MRVLCSSLSASIALQQIFIMLVAPNSVTELKRAIVCGAVMGTMIQEQVLRPHRPSINFKRKLSYCRGQVRLVPCRATYTLVVTVMLHSLQVLRLC